MKLKNVKKILPDTTHFSAKHVTHIR